MDVWPTAPTASQVPSSYRNLYATPSGTPGEPPTQPGEPRKAKQTYPEDPAPSERRSIFIDSVVKRATELKESDYLTTGCEDLDRFLNGGLPCFGITEFYGAAGTAKTQLCLQLALHAQLPCSLGGLGCGVVYINTEGAFPVARIAELVRHFHLKYSVCSQENPLDNIVVETALDKDALFRCLNIRIPSLVGQLEHAQSRIRLIIVDSLAAIFRADYDASEFQERAVDLRKVGAALHELGRKLEAAVVVVNQETSSVALGQNVPSLGLTWTNLVTTRLQLSRAGNDRSLEICFAPHLPEGSCRIILSNAGISADSSFLSAPKKPKL